MDPPSALLDGLRPQAQATGNADKMAKGNAKKSNGSKKCKQTRKKAPNKASKGARGKDKALKAPSAVSVAVAVDASNHASVLTDVGKGDKKAGKRPVKKRQKKRSASSAPAGGKKKKPKPAQSRKGVSKSNLSAPAKALADELLAEKGGGGLHGPRKGKEGGDAGEHGGSQLHAIDKKEAHDGYGQLQEQAEAEVTGEDLKVLPEIPTDRLTNWEHFALIYEEYSMTQEVAGKN
tara:strand:- start:1884 stop:2585 length:702 start_codon:yes stop_codon:yes gene_type:complete